MAIYATNGAGTSFNTAANWDRVTNTPSYHASTNITITSGGVTSATFTAPNTTNAATGLIATFIAVGSAGTITATLQQFNGATWVDVASSAALAITSLRTSARTEFRLSSAFVFTTTTANYYRWKLNTSGASGTTSCGADSGGANFAYQSLDNRNAVPTAGDDIMVISPSQGSELTMTLDSSPSIGSGTNTSVPTLRSTGNAIECFNNGTLSWPAATSRTVTCMGNVLIGNYGKLEMGTTSSKVQAGITARLQFNENGTSVNHGMVQLVGGRIYMQGADLTYKKTTLSSGVGTAASPFVSVDAVNWTVGDELLFVPVSNNAANYDEAEIRFIITKNSSTSYVLSATSGGVEAAFTYSHAAGTVLNLTRRVLVDTTNTAQAWYSDFNETSDDTNINLDGVRLETYGSSTTGKTSLIFSNLSTEKYSVDDVVFYRGLGAGVGFSQSAATKTHTWLIFYDHNGVGNSGSFQCNGRNKTFENCYVCDSQSAGFFPIGGSSLTFTDCVAWACGRASATAYGGWYTQVFSLTQENCESHANRTYGYYFASTASGFSLNGAVGTKGTNGVSDFFCASDSFVDVTFENCDVGSATLISNYLNLAPGSVVSFQKLDQTTNNHRWYTPGGIGRSTGPSLADTTTLKTGHLSCRLDSEDTTLGVAFKTRVLARVGESAMCFGMIQKNGAMAADDVTVNLYLPGSTTPDDSYVMPTDSNVNVFAVAAIYPGSVPLFARIEVVAKSTTAGAYTYLGNFFNGTDVLNAFDLWHKGMPSDVMVEQAGDSQAIWAVLLSALTTPGTTGKQLKDALTTGKFLALK